MWVSVAAAGVAGAARPAHADQGATANQGTAAKCVASADRGQLLRDEGKLLESRSEFSACGADVCPAVVRRECLGWLTDIDERLPSIIISVKQSGGADVVGATVSLDGQPLPNANLGRAVLVDPGQHVVRVRHPDFVSGEQTVVVREREKGRVLNLVLKSNKVVVTEPGQPRTAPGPVPWYTWALGGVAVAGGVGFGVLWSSGMNDVSDLRGSCAPYCATDQIDEVRSTLDLARISLGIGIGAAVGVVVSYLLRPSITVDTREPSKTGAIVFPTSLAR